MYIVGSGRLDSQNRICVSGLFRDAEEKEVVLAVVDEQIHIIPAEKKDFGTISVIDAKNRLIIPKWIIKELGDKKDFFFIIGDDDEKILSPKTGTIL